MDVPPYFERTDGSTGAQVSKIAPQLYACISKRRRKLRSVSDGLQANAWAHDIHGTPGVHDIGQYIQLWHAVGQTILTTEPDRLLWKWTASRSYSAKSCHQATFEGSLRNPATRPHIPGTSWKFIWKNGAPPRVRFFHWLADQHQCWTADRLARCGLQHHTSYLLCCQSTEMMHHLLLCCPFPKQVWQQMLPWLRMSCTPPDHDTSLLDW
uniref:Reverse transcriptase zinc-binding domain-containing protein n=1 Tax=Aegilops tauschii subsp. strangulata TaxID=200361 RepID=A0A453NVL8_AEGTS